MRCFLVLIALHLAGTPALVVASDRLVTAPPPERALPIPPNSLEFEKARKMAHGHPNEISRLNGLEAYARGRDAHARAQFERAARYADKYSMARLALMHWYGEGGGTDAVMAYVWADLAAERGYPGMLAIREEIWSKLTPPQQARSIEQGVKYYAEYGDDVAKRRLARELHHGRRKTIGSRTGFVGSVDLLIGDRSHSGWEPWFKTGRPVGPFYADSRWDAARYWQVENAVHDEGEVEVGPLQQPEDAPANE